MLLGIFDSESRLEEPCWECLKGRFVFGLGWANELSNMPSLWGHEDIDLPTWQGRDPLHIFATILEFLVSTLNQEAHQFCVKTEWEIFEEILNSFSFLEDWLRTTILSKLQQKRVTSWNNHPLKADKYKFIDEIIKVVSDPLNLEYNNLLRQLLEELKRTKQNYRAENKNIKKIQERISGQISYYLNKASETSLRVNEVIEFLQKQKLDFPRLFYLLMLFWSDKYQSDRVRSILGSSLEISELGENFMDFAVELWKNYFLRVKVENITRSEEWNTYELAIKVFIVQGLDEGLSQETPNYEVTLIFPFDKLEEIWFIRLPEQQPTYLEADLQRIEEEVGVA